MLSTIKILQIVLRIPAILVAFTFHEYAHAWVADKLGDKTPKFQGRLTLNPLVHIDIIGFVMILIANFGWAKPVQTNPSSYKNYYRDDLKVSIAGPIANLLVAIVFALITGLALKLIGAVGGALTLVNIILMILDNIIYINIMLFFFNMLPIPGMDGFHVFRDLFPSKFHRFEEKIYRYQMLILIMFIATPLASYVIGTPTILVYKFLGMVVRAIAG
jgi:Zn-dependent protease